MEQNKKLSKVKTLTKLELSSKGTNKAIDTNKFLSRIQEKKHMNIIHPVIHNAKVFKDKLIKLDKTQPLEIKKQNDNAFN